jgi:hypothetical protein
MPVNSHKVDDLLASLAMAVEGNRVDRGLAEQLLAMAAETVTRPESVMKDRDTWHTWLRLTPKPIFLAALDGPDKRMQWADTTFHLIRLSGYSLLTLLSQRMEEHPERPLFEVMSGPAPATWTYEETYRHCHEIAALFHHDFPKGPRIALYLENSVEGASCDLACLMHDILCSPLNIHFTAEILADIFDRLQINGVVTDHMQRYQKLLAVQKLVKAPFRIYTVNEDLSQADDTCIYIGPACKQLDMHAADDALSKRKRFPLDLRENPKGSAFHNTISSPSASPGAQQFPISAMKR